MMYNIIKSNPTVNKKNNHWSNGFYSRNSRLAWHFKMKIVYHVSKVKMENHVINSIDAEKAFNKIHH